MTNHEMVDWSRTTEDSVAAVLTMVKEEERVTLPQLKGAIRIHLEPFEFIRPILHEKFVLGNAGYFMMDQWEPNFSSGDLVLYHADQIRK